MGGVCTWGMPSQGLRADLESAAVSRASCGPEFPSGGCWSNWRRLGISEAELLCAVIRSCAAEDLTNAWAFVRVHRSEIDLQIRENEES